MRSQARRNTSKTTPAANAHAKDESRPRPKRRPTPPTPPAPPAPSAPSAPPARAADPAGPPPRADFEEWEVVFGDRLRELMGERTIRDLSDLVGEHPENVRRYLRGRSKPSAAFVVRTAKAFKVTADWMLGLKQAEAARHGTDPKGP